ncbi:twin transmembrane helix small protein [Oceanicella actignis]|nr:twin transmembrane helix small protein [Oceanicella actignis]
MSKLFLLFAVVSCLITLGIVIFGAGSFARGGAFHKRNANRMMRLRLLMQLVSIGLIVATVWLARHGY